MKTRYFPLGAILQSALVLFLAVSTAAMPLRATGQDVPGDPDDLERISGIIEEINPLPFGLPGTEFRLDTGAFIATEDTLVYDVTGKSLLLSDLMVGDRVVAAGVRVLGNLQAVGILRAGEDSAGGERLVEGPIMELHGAGDLPPVIAGLPNLVGVVIMEEATFLVFESTAIRGGSRALAFEDLEPGDLVRARVLVRADAEFPAPEALSIRVLHREGEPPEDRVVELKGRIDSLQPYQNIRPGGNDFAPEPDGPVGLVQVDGRFFDVRTTTRLIGIDGGEIGFADLGVGDLVHLIGQDVGMLTVVPAAHEITVLRKADVAPPVHASGEVTSIDAGERSFVIDATGLPRPTANEVHLPLTGEVTVRTGADTRFVSPITDQEVTFEDLRTGHPVFARGHLVEEGVMEAEVVRLLRTPLPEKIVVTGPIETITRPDDALLSLSGDVVAVVTVRGVEMLVTSGTDIWRFNRRVTAEVLEVGMHVRVEAVASGGSDYTAETVRILDELPGDPKPVTISGLIDRIDPDAAAFILRGTLVRTDENTAIRDAGGNPLGFGDLRVYMPVTVSGLLRESNTTVLARTILVHRPPAEEEEVVTWRDRIRRIETNEEGTQARLYFGSPGRIAVAGDWTTIRNSPGGALGIADLREGQLVRVAGRMIVPPVDAESAIRHVLRAERIHIIEEGLLEGRVRGEIEEIDGERWLVGGRRVLLDEDTRLAERDGTPLEAADFSVGDRVDAAGRATSTGVLHAVTVTRLPGGEPPACRATVAFGGIVEAIDPDVPSVRIDGRTVLVTNQTTIMRPREGRITLEELSVGEAAYVGAFEEESQLVACVIRVNPEWDAPPTEHRITGRIESLDGEAGAFTIRGTTVQTDNETEITNRRGDAYRFEDLAVGMAVQARGLLDTDEVLQARLVVIMDENVYPEERPSILSGRILAVSATGESIDVITPRGVFTHDGVVIDLNGEPAPAEDLHVGAAIQMLDTSAARLDLPEPASRARLVPEVLLRIDAETGDLRTSAGRLRVDEGTELYDLPAEGEAPITLADLNLGDLLLTRTAAAALEVPAGEPVIAARLDRIRRPERSGAIPGFSPAGHGNEGGRPSLVVNDPTSTFGYVSTPVESAHAEPNHLYELEMTVSTNRAEPDRVPTTRLRVNRSDFSRAATLEIPSVHTRRHVPTPEGTTHRLYFVPESIPFNSLDGRGFFFSLDLLSQDPAVGAGASLQLEGMNLTAIPDGRVRVVGTLHRNRFLSGTEGWQFGGADDMTRARHGMDPGALTLAPSDDHSFGYWTGNTGVQAWPGVLYRGRFLVRANSDDTSRAPGLRLRLNTSGFEFGSVVNVDRHGPHTDAPTSRGRHYDVYLYIPEDAAGTDTILASFDITALDGDTDLDRAHILEEFVLEEIRIDGD